MSLYVVCQCGARFTAEPHLAGQVVNCPQCGATVQLPPPAPIPGAASVPASAPASVPESVPPQPPPLKVAEPMPTAVVTPSQKQPNSNAGTPTSTLKTIGVLMMVYGALTAGFSLYAALQVSGSASLIPIPDELGGQYFRGAAQHAEKLQYLATFMSLAFGGIQIAGGLGAYYCRYWGLSVAGSILLMIPCIGSDPCCGILGLPLGIWAIIVVMKEKELFI